jgi:hypothetical protein
VRHWQKLLLQRQHQGIRLPGHCAAVDGSKVILKYTLDLGLLAAQQSHISLHHRLSWWTALRVAADSHAGTTTGGAARHSTSRD